MANLYDRGLALTLKSPGPGPLTRLRDRVKSGAGGSSEFKSTGILMGVGALIAAYFLLRKKKSYQGPDTRDIEASLRAKGRNPHSYGFGRG